MVNIILHQSSLKGIAGKRWNQAANSAPPHTTHPHTHMVPWAPELSRGQCWQLSLTKIAMNEKLVRSLPRKRFCHQPLSYGLGGENRGNHSRGFFSLRRIGFVLTVSATWQIAKSFGKKHPHSSLIQIFGQKNRRANPKTLQAEHFVYFCVHVYANHS